MSRRKLLWASAVGILGGLAGGTVFLRDQWSTLGSSRVSSTTEVVPTSIATTTTTEAGVVPTTAELAVRRQVICRDAWRAAEAKPFKHHKIERLTVHHTAGLLKDNRTAPDHLLSYQRSHQSRGMADFAYHLFIDGHGNVYAGRDTAVVGESFTAYDPTGHLLVVLDGNFEEQRVPDAQADALVDVLTWAAAEYGVSPATIRGHRDFASTACPGKALYAVVKDRSLASRVEDRLRVGVALEPVCGAEAAARVAAIRRGED